MENFSRLKMLAKTLVRTPFKQQWQWRIEIDPPEWAVRAGRVDAGMLKRQIAKGDGPQYREFDLFCRDISYGPTEITTDPVQIGAVTMSFPTGAAPVEATMTMREHADERVSKFFDSLAALVVNPDGTVNLPYGREGYLCKVRQYALTDEAQSVSHEWLMLPLRRGDVTQAQDGEGLLEFPITFVQFRSIGD